MFSTLYLHGSLGDHACYTGLPELYYKKYGKKLGIISEQQDLWKNNQFCELNVVSSDVCTLRYERCGDLSDWKLYRPYRIFCELTGEEHPELTKEDLCPNLYYEKRNKQKQIVICDEAGWESRRGYSFMNELVEELKYVLGIHIIYHRHKNYGPRQINCIEPQNLSLEHLFYYLSISLCYIGYDSGLMHIAAGVNTPQIIFFGGTPSEIIAHSNTLLCLNGCQNPCTIENCSNQCLKNYENVNNIIIQTVDYLKCLTGL